MVLGLMFGVVCLAFTVAATSRPFADMQRNYLTAGAVVSGLLLLAVLLAPALGSGLRAMADEWRPRQ